MKTTQRVRRPGPWAQAITITLALALALTPMAMADCETTAQAAAGAMAARREQRERRASFPDAAARAEATKGCLGALNDWAALVSPVLTPVPDLGGITEELCREARDNALRLVPRELAPAAQAAGRKMYGRDRDFAQEVRDALR